MSKKLVTSYTFDASAQTVTSADFTSLEKIQLITNVIDNIIIYNFADATKGGSLTGTTLTLTYNTTSMADADKLQIFVDDASLAIPASQSGTWTVQPGNTANTTAWKVDGSAVTQPVSAASLPLPTGAATAANQQTDALTDTELRATPVPVSGTVTANLSATDNAVLDQIELNQDAQTALLTTIDSDTGAIATDIAAIETLLTTIEGNQLADGHNVTIDNSTGAAAVNIQDGGNSITVDGTVSVTGVATATNQSTIIGHVDGIETTLGTIDTDTGNIAAGYATEGSALGSGVLLQGDDGTDRKNINVDATTGDVQVDVTNTVTVDATSSGDVPVTLGGETVTIADIQDGTGGSIMDAANDAMKVTVVAGSTSGTEYTDGDADATPTGSVSMGTDGSNVYAIHTDTSGDVQVDVLSSALPTGAATATNQTTIIGHIDGVETLLGTIDADTSTIAGDTTSLDTKIATDTTDDLDSGAGTDTVKVQGIAVPASGGHAVITGDAVNGLDVDVTRVSGTVTVDGSGVTQPVSGTVTANLSATDNAVLDAIQTATEAIETSLETAGGQLVNLGANNDVTVTSGTVTANLGATDNAVLDDIAANQTDASQKTQIVDGAGNVIGSTSNALDVNIASGSSAGTQYTEDDSAATNPVGTALNLIRDDNLSGSLTTADGDNVALRGNNKGEAYVKATDTDALLTTIDADTSTLAGAVSGTEMQVDVVSSALPTGAATAANQQTDALTDTQLRATPVPVSGTVTANLGATDNAVLDQIELNTDDLLTTTDFNASFGTAGTADTQVRTVQGIASMTPLLVDATGQGDVPVTLTGETVTVDLGANNDVTVTSGNITADTELTTADLDTGAGTDTRAVVGLVGSASGGGQLLPGSSTDGLLVNLGSNNDVTVSGTVTANLGATDNAVLDTIETNTDSLAVVGGGTEATALRVTLANDSTGVVSVDDGGGTLTVDNAGLTELAAAINSNQIDVNIATDSVGIGGGTQYAEDTAHTTGDTGTMALAVRDDTAPATLSSADGDYEPLHLDGNGNLWVSLGTKLDQANDAVAIYGSDDGGTTKRIIETDAGGAVAIQDGGNSITVDGTVTETNSAAILADTASIDTNLGTVAGAVAGTEMQVDVVASLPAGTNNIGDVDVLSVIPGTGSTNLGKAEDAAHATGHTGVMALGVRNDSNATSFSSANGDYTPLAVDANGNLQVDVLSAPTTTVTGTVTANLSATDNAVLDQIELNQDSQTAILTTIDQDTGAIRTAVETIDNAISGTEMQVDVVGSLPAGTNAIGKLAANSGVDIGDVDVTSISAGSNLIGDVGIQGRTTGGLSTYYDADLDETKVAVKASAGTIYAIEAFNTTDAPLFLQLFNVASASVTVGTTTPTNQWVIPGNANSDGAGFTFNVPQGIAYGTAITAACTTNSEGSSAPGAGACIVNIHYK